MTSVLAAAPFVQTTLTYSAESGGTTTDEYGNPVPEVTTGTLAALLAPDRQAQLHRLEGADAQLVMMRGELLDPLTFPTGVGVGSVLTLTWGGQASKLTITAVIPNDLVGVAFGTAFTGEMTPDA